MKTQKYRQALLFFLCALFILFLMVLPTRRDVVLLQKEVQSQVYQLQYLERIASAFLGSSSQREGGSQSLVKCLEEGAKQLGVHENILRIVPVSDEVQIDMNHLRLSQLFSLLKPIEEVPPLGRVSFLKIEPEDSQLFTVQARLKEF